MSLQATHKKLGNFNGKNIYLSSMGLAPNQPSRLLIEGGEHKKIKPRHKKRKNKK